MNRKIIILISGLLVVGSFLFIFMFISEKNKQPTDVEVYEEKEKKNQKEREKKAHHSGNEEYQNGFDDLTFQKDQEGIITIEDASEKYDSEDFNIEFFPYKEEDYQLYLNESYSMFNKNEIERGLLYLEEKLAFISQKNNPKWDEMQDIRVKMLNFYHIYDSHSDLNDTNYDTELDLNFMKEAMKMFPRKEYVLPFNMNIKHMVLVHLIPNQASIVPVVLESKQVKYAAEFSLYEGADTYQAKGVYGEKIVLYSQDFSINDVKYQAVIGELNNTFFLWKINAVENVKESSLIIEKNIQEWLVHYERVLGNRYVR